MRGKLFDGEERSRFTVEQIAAWHATTKAALVARAEGKKTIRLHGYKGITVVVAVVVDGPSVHEL
jgi:hypothetical protein